jgi:DNA-directed RNA polymerase specialized sigma24 family protein
MDLVQTTVLNFLSWGPRFVPQSGAQFRALLKRIATNEIIDQRRRRGSGDARHLESFANTTNPLSGFAGPGPSANRPTHAVEVAEDQEWVRLALQFLPEEDRYLLLSSEVEGVDWASISRELDMASPDAARVRGARLKPRLANILRQLRAGKLPIETNE